MTDSILAEIPFFKPYMGDREEALVLEALRSGWLTSGPFVQRFETLFAAAVGTEHAVALNSCTAALHVALRAWGIGPGDEVLLPTMTFASAAEVVMHLGATPRFVDVDQEDLTIHVGGLARSLTSRSRAIMPMHYAGNPCEMQSLMGFAEANGLVVVDDAAHAFPATYRGRSVGSLANATCFSFYANKTISTGEGGMVTTSDGARAEEMRSLSLHGLSRGAWKRFGRRGSWDYDIERLGYKYNMSDIAAALGVAQLERSAAMRELRAKAVAHYDSLVGDLPWLRAIQPRAEAVSAHHLYVVVLADFVDARKRDPMISHLRSRGINCSVHYRPLHQHTLLRERFHTPDEELPVASALAKRIISLPLYPSITGSQIDQVVAGLMEAERLIL